MLTILKNEDIKLFEGRKLDLFVESYSNATRTIQIRGFTEEAQILADHTTNSDRSLATSVIPITEIPVSLTVRTATTGVSPGACYVKVYLRAESVVVALLIAGYIGDTEPLAWPNGVIRGSNEGRGLIRSITGTNPAAGAEISETVPTGAVWRFIGIQATLVTEAGVASRFPHIRFDDGTTVHSEQGTQNVQSASQTLDYSAITGSWGGQNIGSKQTWPIGDGILMGAGHRVRTNTINILAGDNWGAPQLLVEEWIQP